MKKILYVANITQHIIRFHIPYLKWFKEHGFEVHVAANGTDVIENCDVFFDIPVQRTPFSMKNYDAYKRLKAIIDTNEYDVVVGNTSIAAGIMRLAARSARKRGTKVVFFAHGLHFYNGASIKKWIIYYPIERYFAFFTDRFVTINSEDCRHLAQWYPQKVFQINGVGVKHERFFPVDKNTKSQYRQELGYAESDFILVYSAEFIERKNHRFIIDSTQLLASKVENLKILFLGRGITLEQMKLYAQGKGVDKFIDFLGFRNDVPKLIAISDVGISASKVEGLGLNIVEEMLMALPVVATVDKGHKELIKHGVNGYLFQQNSTDEFVNYIHALAQSVDMRVAMGAQSYELAQKFILPTALKQYTEIIETLINE